MQSAISETYDYQDLTPASFNARFVLKQRPIVLRGLIRHWTSVEKGLESQESISDYLKQFYQGAAVEGWFSPPSEEGRFFYNKNLTGFNFARKDGLLDKVLDELTQIQKMDNPPSLYVGGASLEHCLPGFLESHALALVEPGITPNLWVGNRSVVAAHYDTSENIACVVAGSRRFTLFPPEQVGNLYVGPLEITPAGPPISMVSVKNPDFDCYPKYRDALNASFVAELEAGDAIYIPPLWWHNVESLDNFNMLVNYWWSDVAQDTNASFNSMIHGILAIAQLPKAQRSAWKAFFDYFVFQVHGKPAEHFPEHLRGPLKTMSPGLSHYIKSYLMNALSKPDS